MANELKDCVQVAVIGGGVVGCSVLYHLTKAGWKDVALFERDELTSGSTWHAAGGCHTLNGDPNVAKLQAYTINLYKEIEEISGQSCGLHETGGILLAGTEERMDFIKMAAAKGRNLGMNLEVLSAAECKRLIPLIEESRFAGGLYDPNHGHVDPSGVTNAYAKAARVNGAEVYRFTKVEDLTQRPDGSWDVITNKGAVRADHVVNAGGLWARECGRMAGLELPVLAMEHMYLLTEDLPEVKEINDATGKEVLHIVDFEGELYLRQEQGGMLMGTYEKDGVPWSPHTTPWDFGHELLQPDLDRISESLELGFEHFPCFRNAGIRQIINGPFTFAPDGNPLVGPVRGLRNYWCACAVMAGLSQGGGVGLALANWITEGDPGFDVWGMDVARYGDWATLAFTNAKVQENYSNRWNIIFPNEERPAGRPLRTTPIYDKLAAAGAVFGAAYGMEHALWFSPDGPGQEEEKTFRRSNAFEAVAAECKTVREAVGVIETSTFAKYEITGPGAEAWLSMLLANRTPKAGRMALTPMLNHNGKLIGDFTVGKLADDRFMMFGSGVAENYHMRWFERHLPEGGGVSVRAHGLDLTGLSIAGPKSKELFARLQPQAAEPDAMTFLDIKEMDLGMIPALVSRITFTGDTGYEIWVRPEYQRGLFDAIMTAGGDLGIKPFGSRALNSLRLEKNFGTWAREYRPIHGPFEAGLDRFVALSKNDFIGREKAAEEKTNGPERKLVTLTLKDSDADCHGDEPIWHDGGVVGWITSGGYAHGDGVSVAMGYVPANLSGDLSDGAFEVELLGNRIGATLRASPLFDPDGQAMRL